MEVNNTSLHNEFLLHRLSMIPIYLDPETYENQYIFYLNVKHDSNQPFRFVTTDDIKVYPLKNGVEPKPEVSLDDYDLQKPLSKQEHRDIFRPFQFREKEHPILLTELKNTDTDGSFQELVCYGVPSVSDGREHARWKCCSDAMYTFLENEELFMKIANDKAGHKKIIDDDERTAFIESLRLAEGERYYYRDVNNEPHRYTFTITSIHHYTSKQLFIKATELMISKLENVEQQLINMMSEQSSTIRIEPYKNENTYNLTLCGENDTLGNVLQSHIVNKHIDDEGVVSFCGYRKSHPLEEHVNLYISINPSSKVYGKGDELKMNALVKYLHDVLEDIITIYREIGKEATKSM